MDDEAKPSSNLSLVLSETLEATLSTVGAALKNNALVAFNRLLVSAADVANAKVQRHVVLTNANTAAEKLLVDAAAEQLAKRMEVDPTYVIAANTKFAAGILRKQVNVNRTVEHALEALQHVPASPGALQPGPNEEVSPDWLNNFESLAEQMSTAQAQRLFGRILAGEIRRPGSFSIRTVKLLAELDNDAARMFVAACSMAVAFQTPSGITDVVLPFVSDTDSRALEPWGIDAKSLHLLREVGLITTQPRLAVMCRTAVVEQGEPKDCLLHQGRRWALHPQQKLGDGFKPFMWGIAFTRIGMELFPIVELSPKDDFTAHIIGKFETFKLRMDPLRMVSGAESA